MNSPVRLHVLTGRHHDQTEGVGGNANRQRLWTAPDVHDFGIGQLPDTSDERRDDASQGCERMLLEVTGDIDCQGRDGARAEGHEEGDKPHPASVRG